MSKYARKVDANHAEIVARLQAIGCFVLDLSRVGEGCPDILAMRAGRMWLVEIKDGNKPPSARKLTPAQFEMHALISAAGGHVHLVTSADAAQNLIQDGWDCSR